MITETLLIGFSKSSGNQGSNSAHRWVLANYAKNSTEKQHLKINKYINYECILVADHPKGGEIVFTG